MGQSPCGHDPVPWPSLAGDHEPEEDGSRSTGLNHTAPPARLTTVGRAPYQYSEKVNGIASFQLYHSKCGIYSNAKILTSICFMLIIN